MSAMQLDPQVSKRAAEENLTATDCHAVHVCSNAAHGVVCNGCVDFLCS